MMFRPYYALLVTALVTHVGAVAEPSPPPIREYDEAQAGLPAAQLKVAEYYVGMFAKSQIGKHFDEALYWAQKSARKGHYQGMALVVQLRLDGPLAQRDVKEANYWLQHLHDDARVETQYATRLAFLHDSGELGVVSHEKAYFFCLLQRMTGVMSHDLTKLQQRLRERDLKPEQIALAEKRAFDWWENRNKPVRPLEPPVPAPPVNRGSARLAKRLGEEKQYILRGSDDIEKPRK